VRYEARAARAVLDEGIRARKRALIRQQKRTPVEVAQHRKERICFWTWPFGHVWSRTSVTGLGFKRVCVVCDKEQEIEP